MLIWMADAMMDMAEALKLKDDVKHWKMFRSKLDALLLTKIKFCVCHQQNH